MTIAIASVDGGLTYREVPDEIGLRNVITLDGVRYKAVGTVLHNDKRRG